jgi:hypothetical protein
MGRSHGGASMRRSAKALTAMLAISMAIPVAVRADVLPDGRAYEQVSPIEKFGSDAGSAGNQPQYSWATADGNGLLYGTRGPMGTVHRGIQAYAVGRRGADGWSSESALPSGSQDRIFALSYSPYSMVPSTDLTSIMFTAQGSYVADNPATTSGSSGLYVGHADGTVDWLSRPLINNPLPAPGSIPAISWFEPVGASPDLSTTYFWAAPTLLPEDAARTPFLDINDRDHQAWGLYEYSGGVLQSAETLPNGTEPSGGAAPASSGQTARFQNNFTTPETTSNQVSRDGSTLWFVSPDPGVAPTMGAATQLYVRREGRSALVSHTPSDGPAPSGVTPVHAHNQAQLDPNAHEYAYGAADGKSAIFQTTDALTNDAPSDSSQKAYSYDVTSRALTYLPGVDGTIVAASDDNQRFLFGNGTRIALWDHGVVKTIVNQGVSGGIELSPARATTSGSVFLFSTRVAIPGYNSGGFVQIYRYEPDGGKLTCVSCPPNGVVPSGNGTLSNEDSGTNGAVPSGELVANRGMSDDGNRVFFDALDPLVPHDANGRRDVYEWTPSGVSLISSGRSQQNSYLLDSSANGNDVFFATSEGLDPADLDQSFDVYDARVGGGFKNLTAVTPCAGDECRSGVSGAATVPTPGSGAFTGPGNAEPPAEKPEPAAKLKLGSRKLSAGTLVVPVTIGRPGRVTVTGTGLRQVSKSYAKSGSYTIKVSLTAAARRTLKAKHRLKLSVRVGYTPEAGPASSVRFTLSAKG